VVIPLKPDTAHRWRLLRGLALLGLLLPYLISGVMKLLDFGGAQAEVAALLGSVAVAPITAAVIAVQLGASALLLRGGRLACVGGVALAAFTLAATFLAHRWWGLPPGPDRAQAFNGFWEHIALVGALLYAALAEFAA
jgi:transmembrane protein